MAYRYEILNEAQIEYESIILCLLSRADGPGVALSFMGEFDHQAQLTCENPDLHGLSKLPELRALGYHVILVKSYLVLYFSREETVFLTRVFHRSQDYARIV